MPRRSPWATLLRAVGTVGIALAAAWSGGASACLAQDRRTPAGEEQVTRGRLLELFQLLHSPDRRAAAEAEATLLRLGLEASDLETGRRLADPDPSVRAELARGLAASVSPVREELLLELSRDPSPRVRSALLEAVANSPAGPRLHSRIRELAADDPDAVVRGRARLVATDWAARPSDAPVRPDHRGAIPVPHGIAAARPSGAPSGAGPVPHERQPPRSATNLLQPVRPYWLSPTGTDRSAAHTFDSFYVDPNSEGFSENGESFPGLSGVRSVLNRPGAAPRVRTASAAGLAGTNALVNAAGRFNQDESGLPPIGDFEPFTPGGPFEPGRIRPEILERPLVSPLEVDPPLYAIEPEPLFTTPIDATLGFAGPSSVLPTEAQTSPHFVPVEDRWRIGFPEWDRYGRGHPWLDDYPYVEGNWWDPYNQNVLKGDYPVIGQNTFLNVTLTSLNIFEFREVPTATTPFESTFQPFQENFFGDPRQFQTQHFMSARFDLFHGNTAAFKPVDWRIRLNPIYNINHLRVHELGQVSPDVRRGRTRTRDYLSLNEWFLEAKLADLGPDYDFASVRAGNQFFNSDFRGFVFVDTNRAVRLFGTQFGNRDQFNIIFFDQVEKETNSELNTFEDRHQNTFIANYYRQDFFIPGYNAQISYHFNDDGPSVEFDRNRFLVRPDPAGNARPHRVRAHYLGATGDGHIGRINVSNAFYYVLGRDDHNPIGKRRQDIRARMGALELSIDRDWIRFRTSVFHASGDRDPFDGKARGFDAIFDNPNFAGGDFTYWQRNAIRLFGVNLTNRQSPIPNLRSSRIQGQTNFVNPGLNLVNAGMDFEVTPKLKLISNANYLWFDSTAVLEQFAFQDNISSRIGADLSLGIEYRPFLNDNVIMIAGLSALITGRGFDDLYAIADPLEFLETRRLRAPRALYSNFLEVVMQF